MKLVNIGYSNMVSVSKIVAVVSPDSSPIKRAILDARADKTLIDASYGRKTRAALFTNSGQLILSALTTETIAERINEIEDE